MAVAKQAWQYDFGRFRLDVGERRLLCDGRPLNLAPKVFDTLVILVENSPRLVTKDEMMSRLWPDTFVEEVTLARNISDLRKALNEAAAGEVFVETVPRHGYRFVVPVSRREWEAPAIVIEKHSRSRLIAEQEIVEGLTPLVDPQLSA
ncbi:MAG TPA: winged helix-turn-helix domain-containing protein, partial [Blastocatellia bacterium]|nr:winged helix-turn-helix domain-containing protein [Blastocatellia bacterium]